MDIKTNIGDDAVSLCGTVYNEAFTLSRSRHSCTSRDLRCRRKSSHPTRNMSNPQIDQVHSKPQDNSQIGQQRFNTIFHYYRFIVIMFGGASVGAMFLTRFNTPVAILNMVNQTSLYMEEHPNKTMEDFLAEGNELNDGEFHWNNEVQQMINSWYMMTYTLPQFPLTKLGTVIGSRLMVPISLAVCAISTLLTPYFAYFGYEWVIALRLVNGVGGSAVLPLMIGLIESWMPYAELSLGLTISQILLCAINAATPLIAGCLAAIHWSWAFYGPGLMTLVLCVLWMIFITSAPDENWFVSERELSCIKGCDLLDDEPPKCAQEQEISTIELGDESARKLDGQQVNDQELQVSWLYVFRTRTFYYYLLMFMLNCSAYATFTFILPVYLREFYKIPISENGIFCCIIHSGAILAVIWPHPVLRLLQTKYKFTETQARRSIHVFITSVVLITHIFVGVFHEFQLLTLFLNRAIYVSNDVIVVGNLMGNYAKSGFSCIVFSIANSVGNLMVVPMSIVIGILLDSTGQSREAWCIIFCGLGLCQLLFCLSFVTLVEAGPLDFSQFAKPRDNRLDNDSCGNSKPETRDLDGSVRVQLKN